MADEGTGVIDQALVERITRTIVERFDPERIILFGSRARGDAGADSDLDLVVVMESTKSPPRETSR